VRASTSAMLCPCDEFLFYEDLEGVKVRQPPEESAKAAEPEPGHALPERLDSLITRTLGGLEWVSGEAVCAAPPSEATRSQCLERPSDLPGC
jgi:hypothetical protein